MQTNHCNSDTGAQLIVGSSGSGNLIRHLDWPSTPLGPIKGWSHTLRTIVNMLLAQPLPMVVRWGPDLIQIYNDGYARICGDKHPRAMGMPTKECWPDLWPVLEPTYQRVLSGESVFREQEWIVVDRFGAPAPGNFSLSYSPVRDDRGAIAGILLTAMENTTKAQAEEKLLRSEERFRLLVEQTVDGIFVADVQGRYTDVNSAGCQMLGYTREEVLSRTIADIIAPEELCRIAPEVACYAGGRVVRSEWRFKRKDGSFFIGEVVGRQLPDGRLQAIARDITERRRAEESLRESQARFRAVVENSRDGILFTNAKGVILYRSDSFQSIAGYTAEERVGRDGFDVIHPDDVAELRSGWIRLISRPGAIAEVSYRIRHKDGSTRLVESHIQNLLDNPAVGAMVLVTRDVTDRRAAEERIQQQQMQLAHLSRVSSVGEMATGIAHEMNQPLQTIINYAEVCDHLLTGHPGQSDVEKALKGIMEAAERAGGIIKRYRAFASHRTVQVTSVRQIADVVDQSLELVSFDLRQARIKVKKEYRPAHPPIEIDPVLIQQVMINLIRNAIEAMCETPPGDRRITLRTGVAEQGVTVEVEDSGTGVQVGLDDQVFDSFVTTKPTGLGLGLSISRNIIETHGGRLEYRKNAGNGATFWFTLPIGTRI